MNLFVAPKNSRLGLRKLYMLWISLLITQLHLWCMASVKDTNSKYTPSDMSSHMSLWLIILDRITVCVKVWKLLRLTKPLVVILVYGYSISAGRFSCRFVIDCSNQPSFPDCNLSKKESRKYKNQKIERGFHIYQVRTFAHIFSLTNACSGDGSMSRYRLPFTRDDKI